MRQSKALERLQLLLDNDQWCCCWDEVIWETIPYTSSYDA